MSAISRLLGIVTKKELRSALEFHAEIHEKLDKENAEIKSQLVAHDALLNEIKTAFIGHLDHEPAGKRFSICYKELNSQIDKGQSYAIKVGDELKKTIDLFTQYKNEHLEKHEALQKADVDNQYSLGTIEKAYESLREAVAEEKKDSRKAISRCNERIDAIHKTIQNRRKVKP